MNISLQSVFYTYQTPIMPPRSALKDISFEIKQGEVLAIVGISGSGKSTLLQHLNGLLEPTSGTIAWQYNGKVLNASEFKSVRHKVGMVFQFPEVQFFEEYVFDEIAYGPRNLNLTDEEIEIRIQNVLQQVHLDFDHFQKRSPHLLSGGEKRRVAIASILAMSPEVLVMDEPTVGLDPMTSQHVETIMRQYNQQNRSLIFVSHDMDLVARLASRVIVLQNGCKVFDGTPLSLFSSPEKLEAYELDLPVICQVMQKLKTKGMAVDPYVFTVADAKREIDNISSRFAVPSS